MSTRLSHVLGITTDQLDEVGIYDSMIDSDNQLFIDPVLFDDWEGINSLVFRQRIVGHFRVASEFSKYSKEENDTHWQAAIEFLIHGRNLACSLGYAMPEKTRGGIALTAGGTILRIYNEFSKRGLEGFEDIIYLMPVVAEGVDWNWFNELMIRICPEEFKNFTAQNAEMLNVNVPVDRKGQPIIFVPKALLNPTLVAEQWKDILVPKNDDKNKDKPITELNGKLWKEIGLSTTKRKLKNLLIEHPYVLKELVALYKNWVRKGYFFEIDRLKTMFWDIVPKPFLFFEDAESKVLHPLWLSKHQKITANNIFSIAKEICNQFKTLLEHNGVVKLLYDENKNLRPEQYAQALFLIVATTYCKANNLDLSPETNAGAGAVDFKISRGTAKVTVEIKYSKSTRLLKGFEKQLPAYNKAENVKNKHSIYMVLRVNDKNDHKLKKITGIIKKGTKHNIQPPNLIIVDAIMQLSASKRK